MTSACPRCHAPLAGPVCGSCGARFDVPAGAPPVSAYPPPPMMPLPPLNYGYAPGFGPAFPQGAPMARGKGMAVPGGILSIITGAIVLVITVAALSRGAFREHGTVLGLLITCGVLGAAAVLFGVFALKARWWGCLVAGITNTVTLVFSFAFLGVVAGIEKEQWRLRYDDYQAAYGSGVRLSFDDLETLKAIGGGLVLTGVVALVACIFCYIGVSSSKAYDRYRKHLEATQQF